MDPNQLQGKVAIITGSSSGMGRCTAVKLAKLGAAVVCCDLRAESNPNGYEDDVNVTTVDKIKNSGGKASFVKVDISQLKEVEAAFAHAINEYGRVDISVNCAGYWTPFKLFQEEDDELWDKMARVNTLGTSKANRLAVAQFLKQDFDPAWGSRGKIVNVSSCAACIAFPGEVAYSATKAAINHMTRAAALDQAKDHININCVAPGVVATGMARQNIEDDAIVALMKKATPLPRLGTVEDIANAVVFLCAKESSWITGQTWAVDGGMTLGVPPA